MNLFFRFIEFLILAGLLFALLRKPAKDFFAARAQTLGKAVEEAHKAHQAAWVQHEEVNRRLKNLENETKQIMASFREEGEEEKKKLVSQAEEFAEKIKEDASLVADGEVKKAKEELKEMAIRLSGDLAYKMVEKEMKPEDRERLIGNYLENLRGSH